LSFYVGRPNDAIICYEQAIKHNTNKRAVTRAIYEITKIKIENRDYYEALYTLERAQYLDIDERVIKKFSIFINGVTAMMKKNYADGVAILTGLA
jgi:tetratricopeptide (TPR) repeat protein